MEIIVNPQDYYEIFKEHGKVHNLATDVKVLHWISAIQDVLKPSSQWHFIPAVHSWRDILIHTARDGVLESARQVSGFFA